MDKSEALAQASFDGDLNLVASLLRAGADINARGNCWTPLHAAIENMQAEVVRYLLEAGADPEFACCGMRALHHAIDIEADSAAQANDPWPPEPVVTRMLLEAGADASGADGGGETPLQWARRHNHVKAAELLEARGAA
jgi:ankyrin repeat protein